MHGCLPARPKGVVEPSVCYTALRVCELCSPPRTALCTTLAGLWRVRPHGGQVVPAMILPDQPIASSLPSTGEDSTKTHRAAHLLQSSPHMYG